jgi:hypothetical protein
MLATLRSAMVSNFPLENDPPLIPEDGSEIFYFTPL